MLRNDGQARRYHFFQARTVTCLVGLTCELVGNCLLLTEALHRKNRKCSNAVLYLSFPCLLCTAGQCQRVNCTRNNNTCVFTIATFPLLFRQLTAAQSLSAQLILLLFLFITVLCLANNIA